MILALLFAAAMAASPSGCTTLVEGPAEGMCVGTISTSSGAQVMDLQPAPNPGPPLSAEMSSTVAELLKSYDQDKSILQSALLIDATQEFCSSWSRECFKHHPLNSWLLRGGYRHNAPYLLSDGRVRIEWLLNGKLTFLSFLTLQGAKIKDVLTGPAQMPVMPSN